MRTWSIHIHTVYYLLNLMSCEPFLQLILSAFFLPRTIFPLIQECCKDRLSTCLKLACLESLKKLSFFFYRLHGWAHLRLHHGPPVPELPVWGPVLVWERGLALILHPWTAGRAAQGSTLASHLRQLGRHRHNPGMGQFLAVISNILNRKCPSELKETDIYKISCKKITNFEL